MAQIFIVDNSESMRPYRKPVQLVIEMLGYLLKDADIDNIKVLFTQSQDKIRRKTRDPVEFLTRAHFSILDMRSRLNSIP